MSRPMLGWALALVSTLAIGCASDPPPPEVGPSETDPVERAPEASPHARYLEASAEAAPLDGRLVMLTGSPGGAYYEVARGMGARAAAQDVPLALVPTAGSVETLYQLAWGHGDLGILQVDVLQDPVHRRARQHVSVVWPLFLEEVHVLVAAESSVQSLSDLEGQTVSIGAPASGSAATAQRLLEAAGLWKVQHDRSGTAEALGKLRGGEVAAVVVVGGHPVPSLIEAEGVRVLSLGDELIATLQSQNPNYRATTLSAGAYPWLEADVPTLGVPSVCVARNDVDAGPLVAALGDGLLQLGDAHPKAGDIGTIELSGDASLEGLSVRYRDPALPLRVASGAPGGSYARVGEGIARSLDGATVETIASAGSLQSLILLATGEADLALVQEDVVREALASPQTSPLVARVRLVAPLHGEQVHLVRSAAAEEPLALTAGTRGLEGLRLAIGAPGSGTQVTARALLRRQLLGRGEFDARPWGAADALQGLREGQLDAAFLVGSQPLGSLDQGDGLELVSIHEHPGYGPAELSYSWLTEPSPTIATRALLLARFDLDAAQVTAVAQALFANRANLATIEGGLAELSEEQLQSNVEGLALHPGSEAARGTLAPDSASPW